ncbi:Piso0_002928 [Millerozyma farinosa CBS 7064]|uniref:Piso0_002928 protein n=1 Tax=Pichia sorbitophila (strain ATCC MYA-4447 / BCRC 22081 / CBS 7064 / NBRC 10061 / NRRL Y-12695) TaxID=559304 RepID=G8YGQ0_PICSO|nr:Piso0_002928 [Millerozyma farinosa CBS 7064]CCE80602.1 Piso0_002928 [Millerozyma farinosa CBS 7064]
MSEATAITAVQQRHNPLSSTVAFPKKLQDPYTNVWSTRTVDTTRIVGFANTDPLVEAHVLHERVLARAHSDLAVHKHQPRSRLQRIDDLLVELALIAKLVSRDLTSVYVPLIFPAW